MLVEIEEFKKKLSVFNPNIATANTLKDIVDSIINFIRTSGLDIDSVDPLADRLKEEFGWIKDHVTYGTNNDNVRSRIKSGINEALYILEQASLRVKARSNSWNSGKQ